VPALQNLALNLKGRIVRWTPVKWNTIKHLLDVQAFLVTSPEGQPVLPQWEENAAVKSQPCSLPRDLNQAPPVFLPTLPPPPALVSPPVYVIKDLAHRKSWWWPEGWG
jgi:hypothetical protein